MKNSTTITVDMEEEILGVAQPMYILREDVIQFKKMEPISATCINVYMRHLSDELKKSNTDGIFRFCDASSISVGTPEEKAQVLATRLQQLSTRQILLVPYNSGSHWTLTIINEEKNICYYMDPLHSETYPVGWKSVVNNGIKKYNEKRGGGHQKIPQWKTLKGPKQPSNVECGYYVMRYMKEIVEDKGIFFSKKWGPKKSSSAYMERAVDEVCLEWASLVYRSLPKSGR
ncbi:PREDICTED: sentrin-specific protease 1-like [Fragaria vesca subsp. vesca]